MASPFKQEQRGKVKFEGQRKKLPGLFPGWPPSDLWWHFVFWVIWHAHSWASLAVKESGKCCPNKRVLLIKKERMDTGWATGLDSLTFQHLP